MADIIGLLCILIITGIILACFLRDDFDDEYYEYNDFEDEE